jgi:hypothetical protein
MGPDSLQPNEQVLTLHSKVNSVTLKLLCGTETHTWHITRHYFQDKTAEQSFVAVVTFVLFRKACQGGTAD